MCSSVVGVALGVGVGVFFEVIILNSWSGSFGIFRNLSQDPLVQMCLLCPSIFVGAQVQREF